MFPKKKKSRTINNNKTMQQKVGKQKVNENKFFSSLHIVDERGENRFRFIFDYVSSAYNKINQSETK